MPSRLRPPDRMLDWRWMPAYGALALVLFLARPEPAPLAVGLLLVAAGLALRVWGTGHLVKTERLIRSGPYAYLRHPLYAGTLLIGIGLVLTAWGPAAPWAAALLLALFFGYYLPYKERVESARLEQRHGEIYRRYRERVPALVPRGRRWPPPELRDTEPAPRWSARRFLASSERQTVLAVGCVLVVLGVRSLLVP